VNAGIYGVVIVAVLVALWLLFWVRGRRLGTGGMAGFGGRIDLARGFPHTLLRGYSATDVDDVLDRVYAMSADEQGRAAALENLHGAQFEVARGGYDPTVVDLHVDAMIVALQTGRELPIRPGAPRP
jgi:DivIVA domain-containing protein